MILSKKREIVLIFIISIITSFIVSLFFYLFPPSELEIHVPHGSNEVVERNYDGPIYAVIAKTLYSPEKIKEIDFNKLPPSYYANHFPLYPILIRVFSFFGNYLKTAVFLSFLCTALFTVFFYLFLIKFKLSKNPFMIALISLFIPPRWLAVRTVGGTEPFFLLFLLFFIWSFLEKKYKISSLIGVMLVLTRPPGIVFFFSVVFFSIYQLFKTKEKYLGILRMLKRKWLFMLMPISLLCLFYFFYINFGDFFAYFKTGTGTNVHLKWIPFAPVVGYNTPTVEGFLYLLALYSVGVYILWKKNQKFLAIVCLTYLLPNFFMTVDDIHRYLIPIAPFCLIIPFEKIYNHQLFRYLFLVFLVGIYIYTFSLLPKRMFHYWDYASLRIITSN